MAKVLAAIKSLVLNESSGFDALVSSIILILVLDDS